MSKELHCLLCESTGHPVLVNPAVRDDPSGCLKVVQCSSCGHVQLFPLPLSEEDRAFYEADGQTRNLMGEADFLLWQRKAEADTVRRVRWLQSIMPSGSGELLDVGCGYGFFVDACIKAGYKATGVDVSSERLALARAHLQGTFIRAELDDAFVIAHLNSYQVVTLFHVLEHMRTPVAFTRHCFDLVAPGGWLLIEIPNLSDELLQENTAYRDFFWQRAHLSYFDAAHLKQLLLAAGLKQFSVSGVQRYGLRNLLHWLDEGKPQMNAANFNAAEPILARIEQLYRDYRQCALNCDTIIAEVRR